MTEVPESWPAPPVVPVFPLPELWLVPGTILPLHIFEPRYRQMVEDSLDGPGRIAIATVVHGHDGEDSPPFYPIAGLGEIGRHDKLDDGRFLIWLAGLCRVELDEIESDKLYRQAHAERVFETEVSAKEAAPLRERVSTALETINEGLPPNARTPDEILEQLKLGKLTDILVARLDVEREERQGIFATLDRAERARRALAAYDASKNS